MTGWAEVIFGDTTVVQAVIWIGAFIALVTLIVKAWPWLKRAVRLVDALAQLPDFIERTDTTLEGQNEKIEAIHHEVNWNDGTSAKDSIGRVEVGVAGLYDAVAVLVDHDPALVAKLETTRPKPRNRNRGTS